MNTTGRILGRIGEGRILWKRKVEVLYWPSIDGGVEVLVEEWHKSMASVSIPALLWSDLISVAFNGGISP